MLVPGVECVPWCIHLASRGRAAGTPPPSWCPAGFEGAVPGAVAGAGVAEVVAGTRAGGTSGKTLPPPLCGTLGPMVPALGPGTRSGVGCRLASWTRVSACGQLPCPWRLWGLVPLGAGGRPGCASCLPGEAAPVGTVCLASCAPRPRGQLYGADSSAVPCLTPLSPCGCPPTGPSRFGASGR